MHRSHHRTDLEKRTVKAHGFYINALVLLEQLHAKVGKRSPGITERDVIQAECLLAERRSVLINLLNELGYLPEGLTARLPRTREKGDRRLGATAEPDLAALRCTYLEWRSNSEKLKSGPSARSMLNLGKILTILGLIPEEDEMAIGVIGAAPSH